MIRAKPTPQTARNLKFIRKELPKRVESVQSLVLQTIVRSVKQRILDAIPGGTFALTAYRNGLKTALVNAARGRMHAAVIGTAPMSLQDAGTNTSLLFFSQSMSLRANSDPASAILASFEPWTMDQLPPVRIGVAPRIRTASVGEVLAVRIANSRRRPYVDSLMQRAGVQFGDKPIMHNRGVFDLENYAMRMEFGMPGAPHIPHWRSAVSMSRGSTMRALAADRALSSVINKTLTQPRYRGHSQQIRRGFDTEVPQRAIKGTSKFAKAVKKA